MTGLRRRVNVLLWRLTQGFKKVARGVGGGVAAAGAWVAMVAWLVRLVAIALAERARTIGRRRRGDKPRLIWGPIPVMNLKFWSEAARRQGYESLTCVTHHYPINRREDFDVYRDRFSDGTPRAERLADYRFMAWTLRRGDVFIRFFDGGYLRNTPLDRLEAPLLKLAGKKLIVSPYGGDIAVAGHLDYLEEPLFEDYPYLREQSEETEARVLHTLRWSTLSIANWQFGFLPSYDVVWPTMLAIDTDAWSPPPEPASDADGRNGAVTLLHAPNHRAIKGTEHIERAVEELRASGLEVDLKLLQGVPNHELHEAMSGADVIVDQILAGYAMNALEGLALSKPVVTNLDSMRPAVRHAETLRDCPLIDSDPEALVDDLRRLVENPALRHEIGQAGRDFAVRHHSVDATGREWDAILRHVWNGAQHEGRDARFVSGTGSQPR